MQHIYYLKQAMSFIRYIIPCLITKELDYLSKYIDNFIFHISY